MFKLKEHNTTVRTEIIAGMTTFTAMAYILMVNSGMFTAIPGVSYGAIYIATALSAVVGTLLIGLLSNLPLAQASGMGLNAFFVYTVCLGLGFSYANALVFVLVDGLIFILLTATGLRQKLFNAIPKEVKVAIPAGIGLFIAFLGFQDSGIVAKDAATGVTLASFNLLGSANWASIMPMVVTILTIIAITVLAHKKVKGAVLYGILGGAVLYYLLGLTIPGFYAGLGLSIQSPFAAFKDFAKLSFGKVFTQGFNFTGYLASHSVASLVVAFITTSLAFCLVDMFDTMGTLYGACRGGNLLTAEGEVPRGEKAMFADAVATCAGAVCGTSTVTTYVESAAGIGAGGRTGLTSIVTASMFLVATFLSPIAMLIPACAYSAALIYVGILMMSCVLDIEWTKPEVAIPAFLCMVMMPFTYSISYGIAFGLIAYCLIKIFRGKFIQVKLGTWIITILFALMLLLSH